jgi:hypothetical protein
LLSDAKGWSGAEVPRKVPGEIACRACRVPRQRLHVAGRVLCEVLLKPSINSAYQSSVYSEEPISVIESTSASFGTLM